MHRKSHCWICLMVACFASKSSVLLIFLVSSWLLSLRFIWARLTVASYKWQCSMHMHVQCVTVFMLSIMVGLLNLPAVAGSSVTRWPIERNHNSLSTAKLWFISFLVSIVSGEVTRREVTRREEAGKGERYEECGVWRREKVYLLSVWRKTLQTP